jgi:hypothetical protein
MENPSQIRSSPFLAGYPGTMSHKPPSTVWLNFGSLLVPPGLAE